jgi:hypothetical protein
MSKDEKLLQHVFDLFDPIVRDEWTVDRIVDAANRTTFFFVNGASVYLKKPEFTVDHPAPTVLMMSLKRMARRRTGDGSYAWRLFDMEGRKVVTIALAHPTDPLPAYVAALKEALIGSRVQSVSASDGGLCLHLDDDYDAVTSGALRVRVDTERVPFTVGDVFVNRGGIDFTLCICSQTESKPIVAFKINQDALNGKELSFNVI